MFYVSGLQVNHWKIKIQGIIKICQLSRYSFLDFDLERATLRIAILLVLLMFSALRILFCFSGYFCWFLLLYTYSSFAGPKIFVCLLETIWR